MADEPMTSGEIQRNFARIDQALAAKVSTDMHGQAINHLSERITEVDHSARERTDELAKSVRAKFKALEDRGQTSWGRVATVLTLALSLAGLLLAIYSSSKGIK